MAGNAAVGVGVPSVHASLDSTGDTAERKTFETLVSHADLDAADKAKLVQFVADWNVHGTQWTSEEWTVQLIMKHAGVSGLPAARALNAMRAVGEATSTTLSSNSAAPEAAATVTATEQLHPAWIGKGVDDAIQTQDAQVLASSFTDASGGTEGRTWTL